MFENMFGESQFVGSRHPDLDAALIHAWGNDLHCTCARILLIEVVLFREVLQRLYDVQYLEQFAL